MSSREKKLGPPPRLPSVREMVQAATPTSSLVLPALATSTCANADADADVDVDADADADVDVDADAVHSPSDTKAESRPARRTVSGMKANLRRSRHRDREKREAMFLRAYSSALEAELEQLKQRHAERQRQQGGESSDLARSSLQKEMWRALALMRRGQRKASEQENARLRALWRAQEQFVAQLQQHAVGYRNFGPANGVEARVTLHEADVDLFKVLHNELDGTYLEIGQAMAETGLNCLPEARHHSIRPRDASGAGTETASAGIVDVVSVAQLRTSFSAVQDIMWNSMLVRIAMHGGVRYDLSEDLRENTAAMKVRHVQQSEDGETLIMETVMTARRYRVSPDSMVVVWRCLLMGSGGVSGRMVTESGFSSVNRSSSHPDHAVMRRLRRLETIEGAVSFRSNLKEGNSCGEAMDKFSSMSLAMIEDDIASVLGRFVV